MRDKNAEMFEATALIMSYDVLKNGPVPDDPKEAYIRGIEAVLETFDAIAEMNGDDAE